MSAAPAPPAGGERARLFVALELPPEVRGALEHWRSAAARPARDLRLVDPAALHVTLCFLGGRFEREIEEIGAACGEAIAGSGPPELSLGDPVWLPEGRPRVLAVRIDDPSSALADLQASLSAALSAGGWYAPETRPFLGHVTVGRVKRGARIRPASVPAPPALGFLATGVTLYRSRLMPSGARYEAQRTIELGGHPGDRRRSGVFRSPARHDR